MIFRIRAVSDLLEPCEVKVSSPVLRGEVGGDTCFLPGDAVTTRASFAVEARVMGLKNA